MLHRNKFGVVKIGCIGKGLNGRESGSNHPLVNGRVVSGARNYLSR